MGRLGSSVWDYGQIREFCLGLWADWGVLFGTMGRLGSSVWDYGQFGGLQHSLKFFLFQIWVFEICRN